MPTLIASGTLDNVPGATGPAQSGHLVYAVNAGRWWFFTWAGKLDSGTATSGTTGQLNDTTKSWTTNQFLGRTCIITGGAGAGESFIIGSNTATGLPVIDDASAGTLATAPNNTSTYEILESDKVHAYVSSSSDLSTATWSEATGSPTPTIQTASNNTGYGIDVPGGSNNVGGAGQYPTDGRLMQVAYANVSGVDVFVLQVQMDSHYFQVTLRGRLTAATTIAWDGVVSGTTNNWNDTATGMDCVPEFPQGASIGYSSTGRWWTMSDQNGRIACGYAANSADPGTANFNENWQSNQGASAPSSFDTGAGDTCQSALIPLASGFMLAVYCAGNTASPAGAGNATQTGLRFAESASATQWPTTSTGAAVPNLSSTSNDPNDWDIVAADNTHIHVVRRDGPTTLQHLTYSGHGGSWSAIDTLPSTGLTGHLAGSGVALVSDGSSVWCFVIDTDANHSVRYIERTGSSWATSWSTLSTGTEVKNFISAYMRSDNQQIGVVWTANSSSPFQVNFAALSLGAPSGATWAPRATVARGPFFMSGRQATVWAWPTSVTAVSSTSDPVSGAANSSASGVLSLAESLSGTSAGVGSTSGVLALAQSASGTDASVGAATAALSLAEVSSGTSASPAAGTGSAALQVASSGTSATVSSATGVLSLVEAASGTGAAVSSGTGALETSVSATGSAAALSTAIGQLALAEATSGTSAAFAASTGNAALTESLSGTLSGVSSATGVMAEAVSTSGTSASVGAASGALQVISGAAMQGTSFGVSSAKGVLALVVSAAGTATSPAVGSGSLAQSTSTSGSASGVSSASGALGLSVAATGSSPSVGTGSGTAALSTSSGGTSSSPTSASGSLALVLALAGVSAAVGSGQGSLQTTTGAAFSGTSASVSTATGALALAAALAGTSSGVAQALGAMALAVALSGRSDARAAATGTVLVIQPGGPGKSPNRLLGIGPNRSGGEGPNQMGGG